MKPNVPTALIVLLSSAAALAQGTVIFNNNVPGVVVTHVYWQVGDPQWGNGPDDTPPGSVSYSDSILLGHYGPWHAQLWASSDPHATQYSLSPSYPITTFQPGTNGGFVVPVIATLQDVPADAPDALVQLRVWYGADDWQSAVDMWGFGFVGASLPFVVENLGGEANPPPYLTGLQSFSVAVIPEPSSAALALLGAATLLAFAGPCRLRRLGGKRVQQ